MTVKSQFYANETGLSQVSLRRQVTLETVENGVKIKVDEKTICRLSNEGYLYLYNNLRGISWLDTNDNGEIVTV